MQGEEAGMTSKRDSKSKPKKDKVTKPRIADLDASKKDVRGGTGTKVNPQDVNVAAAEGPFSA